MLALCGQTNLTARVRATETPMPNRPKTINAITLLKEDHKTARGLLDKLEATTERAGESREKLLARIEQELKIHTTIEEEIFYPAYKAAVSKREDTKLYHEALEEHHVVDNVMAEIKASDSGSEEFSAKAKVLKDLVEHHAEEEEKQMFPRARRAMETSELQELGAQMAERKKEMQAGGSWLPSPGKLMAAVAERMSPSRTRSQASVAARGAARKSAGKPGKTSARAKGRSGAKSGSKAGAKSARGRRK
jgi:hemerythrin-like domain-containing protein